MLSIVRPFFTTASATLAPASATLCASTQPAEPTGLIDIFLPRAPGGLTGAIRAGALTISSRFLREIERRGTRWLIAAILEAVVAFGVVNGARGAEVVEGYVTVPGARLWYRDSGGIGVPVILLHAGFGHAEFFERYQFPAFTAAGFRVIAYDRRGYGRSRTDEAGAQSATAVDDLQALVEYLALDRFHLVATAGGGVVALDYLLTFPQRVLSLVIANSIGGAQDPEYIEVGRRLRPPEFDQLPTWFRELGPEYRAANPQGTQQWIEIQRRSRPAGPPMRAQPLRNRITFAALATLDLPVLLLTGDADLYSPPTTLKPFSERMRNTRVVSLPGVGHSAYWEQPEAFNHLVLDFIEKH